MQTGVPVTIPANTAERLWLPTDEWMDRTTYYLALNRNELLTRAVAIHQTRRHGGAPDSTCMGDAEEGVNGSGRRWLSYGLMDRVSVWGDEFSGNGQR